MASRTGIKRTLTGRRRRTPNDWLTEHLPTWLLTQPFEAGVLLIAVLRSGLFLGHVTPATVAEQSLPQPMLYVVLGFYGIAAAFTLAHLARGNLALERAGLLIVGPFAFAYSIVLLATEPVKGLYSFLLYATVAAMCLLRSLVIRKVIRITAAQLRGSR